MIPIRQKRSYDCFAACVASIMHLDTVPNFFDVDQWDRPQQLYWLKKQGWAMVEQTIEPDIMQPTTGVYCIVHSHSLCVPDLLHAAVACTIPRQHDGCFELVHDPACNSSQHKSLEWPPRVVTWLFKITGENKGFR